MEKQEIQKGDIVRLKSGSPNMTVQAVDTNDMVECSWFTTSLERKIEYFSLATLEKVDTNESTVVLIPRKSRYDGI